MIFIYLGNGFSHANSVNEDIALLLKITCNF